MENFGLQIAEGSEITNLTIPTGTSFPANDNVGEMFYRTDEDKLYIRNNTGWGESGGSATVGTVSSVGSTVIPDGYLQCDGSTISRTTYADLFADIGTVYGVGDGSTTFNIPDLRGEFLRGWDDSRGVDAGRSFGSTQGFAMENHTHTGALRSAQLGFGGGSNYLASGPTTTGAVSAGYSVAAETRPRNVVVMYIIKY